MILASMMLLGVWQLLNETSSAVQETMWQNGMDAPLRHALEFMASEIKDSGEDVDGTPHVTTHPPDVTTEQASISFQKRIAFAGETADWDTAIEYKLVAEPGENPSNGIDDDGNGLVDEKALVRVNGQETTTLAHNVGSVKFTRAAKSNAIDITLVILGISALDGQPTQASRATKIALRNVESSS